MMMTTYSQHAEIAAHEETSEEMLHRFERYITLNAARLFGKHTALAHPEVRDMERDELIQRVRIKLWRTLEKRQIDAPYTYIKRIVYSEFIDMRRQQRLHLPLPGDENEYLSEEITRCLADNTSDPATILEHRLDVSARLEEAIQMVLALPPRQRFAMICALKERVDDVLQLVNAFKKQRTNIESLHWPSEEAEKKVLRASLSVARRTLARNMKK
ncbi:MAG: sigma-70 family RNA polymerase sigma factor [Ktedonobacteraceae bacterium]|nr:sigma-70 family RNA polymerase sigma factor [Ktedonobacteraceae bacterium]MBO0789774.1 sigma-70 family RNA polymerase sigma factor [Ktedonobacteraceae bacterium]